MFFTRAVSRAARRAEAVEEAPAARRAGRTKKSNATAADTGSGQTEDERRALRGEKDGRRTDRDLVEPCVGALGGERGAHEVVVARGDAARREEDVVPRGERLPQNVPEFLHVVARDAERDGIGAGAAESREEEGTVRVAQLSRARADAGRHELVARHEDGRPGRADDVERGAPRGGGEDEVGRGEAAPGGEKERAGLEDLAALSHVGARLRSRVDLAEPPGTSDPSSTGRRRRCQAAWALLS